LASLRERFEAKGILLVISDEDLIVSCRDKRLSVKLFNDIGVGTPEIYSHDNIQYPCFSKPYDGSCSIGASAISDESKLTESMLANEKLMFMEFMDESYTEFTIDSYYDRQGELRCMVPRERIEVRSGEVSKAATRRDILYDYLLPKLARVTGGRGCLTVQVFYSKVRDRIVGLEINPRFGGGFPLSYSSGANYPGWLIDEYLRNRNVEFFDEWEADLLMLRYDAKVLVRDQA
jgi:carbamoyl-phosphate synthase large subunit